MNIYTFKYLFFSLCTWIVVVNGFSQNIIQRDTLILDKYPGVFSFSLRTSQNKLQKNGAAKFDSELYKDSLNQRFFKLNIQGNYKDDRCHGYWTFSELAYALQIENIVHNKKHQLDYKLNGSESRVVMRFNNGQATGRWMIDNYTIVNGVQRDLQNSGFIFCENGVFTGAFSYSNEKENISISGNLNNQGFLHGVLKIKWLDSEKGELSEERLYQDGFLLQISRFENEDTKPYMLIEFADVQQLLNDLQNNRMNQNSRIQMSDKHYGILFDNGYTQQDLRLHAQEFGNDIISKFFESFERYINVESDAFEKPIAKLTRRFIYQYNDPSPWEPIELKIDELLTNATAFINAPSNILYAEQSDSVARAWIIMNHILEKTLILEDVVQKHKTDFFDTRDRNNYYATGVPGLNKKEVLYFRNRKNENISIDFSPTTLVDTPENFMDQIEAYLRFLMMKFEKNQLIAFNQVTDLEQRGNLKTIDSLIVHYEQLNENFYGEISVLSNAPFENLSFEQKIFFLAYQRKLSQLRKNYLNKIEYPEKIDLGRQYIDAMQNLSDNQKRLSDIGRRQKRIDSLFTIYEDNPFDYRKIELPILSQIKEKGLLLFRHYAELLFAETRTDKFIQRLAAIEQLLDKLEYYAANYNNQDVQALNRALRRESVPNRIERLFEIRLDNDNE
jgi:hypothetical protein